MEKKRGGWRELCNEELHEVYLHQLLLGVFKSWRTKA